MEESVKKYLVNCMQKQAPASFDGYNKYIEETIANQKKLSASSKIATAATKVLSAAGINLATTLLSSAFSSALKWLDNYIQRADRAKDALQEFDSKVDDTRDIYRSHSELVNEAAKSYDALSSKVDTSTNLNLGLSEEEYAQFISLNNELAEAFPALVTGYDESGNAILDFGNDCDTASEKLKKLLETERQTMNMQIASELPQLFKDTKTAMADYEKQINQFQTEVNTLSRKNTMLNDISSGNLNLFDNQKIFSANDLGAVEYSQFYDLMSSSLNDFVQTLSLAEKRNLGNLSISSADFMTSDGQSFWLNLVSLSPDQQERLTEIIQENAGTISKTLEDELSDAEYSLQTATTAKDSLWSDFTQNLVAGMNTKAGFQDLSEEGQQMATSLVQSLNSSVANEMDATDPYAYIRENIVSVLGNSEQDTISALNKNIGEHLKADLSLITTEVQNTANVYFMETTAEKHNHKKASNAPLIWCFLQLCSLLFHPFFHKCTHLKIACYFRMKKLHRPKKHTNITSEFTYVYGRNHGYTSKTKTNEGM